MANLKCAACGFEEGERRFTPIQIGNSSVSLKESQGLNSASFKLTPVTLVVCPECKTVRTR
ncbi:hypothetical protein FVD41_10240 [Bacillus amyloliquefaciens]|nr:hypothetical protein FVD42_10305 [Bacillus amyloliquefaciens]TXK30580.1 hypothetical protein FVD41_10240 [Bacillus amyloliquefaciens]